MALDPWWCGGREGQVSGEVRKEVRREVSGEIRREVRGKVRGEVSEKIRLGEGCNMSAIPYSTEEKL